MEEKKNVTNEQPEKLSYEKLEYYCHQYREQAEMLYQQLQEANMVNAFKRLDYLFAVLSHKDSFPKDFVDKSINEIITMMTLPTEESDNTNK